MVRVERPRCSAQHKLTTYILKQHKIEKKAKAKDKKDKGDKKDKKSKKVPTQCHERDAVFVKTSTRRRAASTASTRPHVAATPSSRSRESPRASRTYRGSSATA